MAGVPSRASRRFYARVGDDLVCRGPWPAPISGATPRALSEALPAGEDVCSIRRELPEEFWDDFDRVTGLIQHAAERIVDRVGTLAGAPEGISDKVPGLMLSRIEPELRRYIFGFRARRTLFRAIRRAGNVLPGYVPSFAMNHLIDDAA